MTKLTIKPFSISVGEEVLSDLNARIQHTRWPDQIPDMAWNQGTELSYLRRLLSYWCNGFDWRSWADTNGDLDTRFSHDFLLTNITLCWVTQTITSSMRDFYDNRWTGVLLQSNDRVNVPTGIALFDHQFIPEGSPPREWLSLCIIFIAGHLCQGAAISPLLKSLCYLRER